MTVTLSADERYAFIYSKNIDDRFINFYDKVIVEADSIDNIYALRYPEKMVAYVSIGEIEPWRKSQKKYDESWVISKNKTWDSLIADLSKKKYQQFLMARFDKLYKKGYRHFFLDTMDAYHATAKDKKAFEAQRKALIDFIHHLHQKYPKSQLIINRGFELITEIKDDVHAIVAESLLNRYKHNKKAYIKVPEADKTWLLARFKEAKELGLTTISIEYSNQGTAERLKIAKAVKKLGIIPYVTDGLLQEQGECEIERVRRDVLILFNKSLFKDHNAVYADVHLLASMPLEHLGYVPILYDISSQELPKSVEDRYHAVIVWSGGKTANNEKLYDWSQELKRRGVKILFLNNFLFNATAERLKNFNISTEENRNHLTDISHEHYHAPYTPFEMNASIEFEDRLMHPNNAKLVLTVDYKNGQNSTPIALTSWGGYALNNSFLLNVANESYWTLDPFLFFKEALDLKSIPVPDPTTEAGRRILFAHVDGDGFMEVVRTNPKLLSSEYLIDSIFRKYAIPQTVSLIEGEVSPQGLYPKLSPRMQRIAKKLYQIPWIEPASHTLSHPFFWGEADEEFKRKNKKEERKKVTRHTESHGTHGHGHLPIPNYPNFVLKRETIDSVHFALSFAPPYKQKEKILFWSGDCLPTRTVLAYTERHGIIAMNGGDTTIKKSTPWLSRVAPFGVQREDYWQIYTGEQNENVYTNDWLGPFWGYRDAVDTFELTEEPRRLKPINIYYHFYSGSKLASLKALEDVYDWAIKQKTSKLYASQYIKKGRGFYRTAIAKVEGGYEVRNSGYLRTLRFDKKIEVDMEQSKGVAGFKQEKNHTYITLDSRGKYLIKTIQKSTKAPYLIDANGWVESVKHHGNHYSFKLRANLELEATFYQPKGCKLSKIKGFKQSKNGTTLTLNSKNKRGATFVFECQ